MPKPQISSTIVTKIIDNATFNATVNSPEINLKGFSNFNVTYVLGTATGSPTIAIKLQYKDIDGLWYDDPDYSLTAISTGSTSGIAFKGFMEAYDTVRVVCTFGGSGSFAGVSVAFRAKS
jgi:hypothetical protein